jgi:hypothetical protein
MLRRMEIKKFYVLIFIFTVFLLSGCDGFIETNVNLSQLQSKQNQKIEGDLYLEVASCGDYSDSRKESDSVKEAKMDIPLIFKNAKYIECFDKELNSYAHFKIPILIHHSNKLISNRYIQIISNKDNILAIAIPSSIEQNIEKLKENSFGITDIDLKVKINFINDTNKKFPFHVVSAYINDEPYIYGDLVADKHSSFVLKLSDVSIDNALKNQFSPVLLKISNQ